MIKCYKSKCAETPENKGMSDSGQRALLNDFGLAKHFPEKVPDASAERGEMKIGVLFGMQDTAEDRSDTPREEARGAEHEKGEEKFFADCERLRFGQRGEWKAHKRTNPRYRITGGNVAMG